MFKDRKRPHIFFCGYTHALCDLHGSCTLFPHQGCSCFLCSAGADKNFSLQCRFTCCIMLVIRLSYMNAFLQKFANSFCLAGYHKLTPCCYCCLQLARCCVHVKRGHYMLYKICTEIYLTSHLSKLCTDHQRAHSETY